MIRTDSDGQNRSARASAVLGEELHKRPKERNSLIVRSRLCLQRQTAESACRIINFKVSILFKSNAFGVKNSINSFEEQFSAYSSC